MRLVYITARYPPHLGGTEIHTYEVARAMADRGHEVAVITTDRSGGLPVAESQRGLDIIRVPAYPSGTDYYIAPDIRRYVKHERADLVHLQSYHTAVAPLTLASLAGTDMPHVLTFHSGGSSKRWRRTLRPLQYRILRRFTDQASAMVAVSEFERQLFLKRLQVADSSIEVIRNGVSSAILDEAGAVARDPNLIMTAGRLEHYKGHHRVIEALPAVQEEVPEAHVLVVGTGPYLPELQELVTRLRLDDAVDFTTVPQTDRAQMGRLLAGAAVTASLSAYEAEGIGAVESRAMGCRTVVTESTALAELVDGDLVIGVDKGASTSATARALVKALKSGPPTKTVDARTWSDVTDDLEALYKRLLA